MRHKTLCKHVRFVAIIGTLIGAVALGVLILSSRAAAQPTTFLSPLSPEQTGAFLGVPYYGAKSLTAYLITNSPTVYVMDESSSTMDELGEPKTEHADGIIKDRLLHTGVSQVGKDNVSGMKGIKATISP